MTTIQVPADQLHATITQLEKDANQAHHDLAIAKRQLAKAREELSAERTRSSRLQRQLDGYDEDAFDPTKQKGEGAIPIGGEEALLSIVEPIERRLGMAPTMDQQMRQLGITSGAEQAGKLLEAENPTTYIADLTEDEDLTEEQQSAVRAWRKETSDLFLEDWLQGWVAHDRGATSKAAMDLLRAFASPDQDGTRA